MIRRVFRKGSALITCTIVLVVISALAVSLASMSEVNVQIADNQRRANQAFANAESGLEITRYWLSRVRVPSSTPPSQYLSATIALVQEDLAASGVGNFRVEDDGSIPVVMLDTVTGHNFQGQWSASPTNPAVLRVAVAGTSGAMSRTITVEFNIQPYHFPIFNYGIATKGPLVLAYNPHFLAATQSWEADIYVESAGSLIAVDISKNATFAGDIDIGNPLASVSCGGSLDLGGEVCKLEEEDRPVFPVPDVERFRQYATGPVIDSTTDLSGSSTTWANAVIAAGTNPTFGENVTLQGILYIEAPNKVMFPKNTTLQGMIVAEGDVNNPGDNQINFGDPTDPKTPSNFSSGPYPAGAEFDALRSEVGSCILAPGFAVSFWKNFSAINGVIAATGLWFDNNATATVQGTLINYSEQATTVTRNINMTFDRSALVEIPAGFDLLRVLIYNPASYRLPF
jgi:hypothetical protein